MFLCIPRVPHKSGFEATAPVENMESVISHFFPYFLISSFAPHFVLGSPPLGAIISVFKSCQREINMSTLSCLSAGCSECGWVFLPGVAAS